MTWSLLKDTWRTLRGWETIFWSDKTQLEHCGLNAKYHIWRKPDTAHQLANTIPKLKHGGGSIKLGDVFQQWDTSYGQGKVNPAMFRSTLDDDLVQNALVLRLRQRFINRTTTLSKEPWYQSSHDTIFLLKYTDLPDPPPSVKYTPLLHHQHTHGYKRALQEKKNNLMFYLLSGSIHLLLTL